MIARAVAVASKAIENFFIFPPSVALAGICPAHTLCEVLTKSAKPVVAMVDSTNSAQHAMPERGIHAETLFTLPATAYFPATVTAHPPESTVPALSGG